MSFILRVSLDFHFFSGENNVTSNFEENIDHNWLFCQEMKIKYLNFSSLTQIQDMHSIHIFKDM